MALRCQGGRIGRLVCVTGERRAGEGETAAWGTERWGEQWTEAGVDGSAGGRPQAQTGGAAVTGSDGETRWTGEDTRRSRRQGHQMPGLLVTVLSDWLLIDYDWFDFVVFVFEIYSSVWWHTSLTFDSLLMSVSSWSRLSRHVSRALPSVADAHYMCHMCVRCTWPACIVPSVYLVIAWYLCVIRQVSRYA